MPYFTSDYFEFFRELAANNNKDWFDIHRKRYENSVKEPFKNLVQEVIHQVKEIDPTIDITPNDATFRINRDIRFSKDKTLYKLNRTALISLFGRKDKSFPGLYLDLNLEKLAIYGGVRMASTEQIHRVREEIAEYPEQFKKIYSDTNFKQTFGEIKGEKAKRLPKEFKTIAEIEPLITHKQWYYFNELKPEMILSDQLVEVIMAHYVISKPMLDFLSRPIQG